MALVVCCVAAPVYGQDPPTAPAYVNLVDTSDTEAAKWTFRPTAVDKEMWTNRTKRNERRFLVTAICKGSQPLDAHKAAFDEYFLKYYYPNLTNPAELPNLSKLRRELARDCFANIKNDAAGLAVRDHLNTLTLNYLKKFVSYNLHPAVRYNAMLIIGDLDSRGASLTSPFSAPDPLNAALEVLLAEVVNPTQIDAVRVAALIGMNRHAELNRYRDQGRQWDDVTLRRLVEPLSQLVVAKKPPSGRSIEGHNWMRRQALESLSWMAATRPMPAVAKIVDDLIADTDAPPSLRCAAAEAQGRLAVSVPTGGTPEESINKLGRLALEMAGGEVGLLQPYLDQLEAADERGGSRGEIPPPRPNGGLLGPPKVGPRPPATPATPAPVVPMDSRVVAAQRRLKAAADSVKRGIAGADGAGGPLAAIKDPAAKAEAAKIIKAIDELIAAVDAPPTGDPANSEELAAWVKKLTDKRSALDKLIPEARRAAPASTLPEPGEDGPAAPAPAAGGNVTKPAGPAAALEEP